jgi:uncharacterized membrane protein YfcA
MLEASVFDYLIVCASALAVSGLTLFSGFGLGTLLMPVFALFFPLEMAIAATAVVHLANNLFKLSLLGRKADWGVVARFGFPGALLAILGALALGYLSDLPTLVSYAIGSRTFEVKTVKLAVGGLIALFAVFELVPELERRMQFRRKHLPLVGGLSGFLGGLSGHQGALRSAALIRCGFSKEVFIATGVVCAVAVDFSRLATYGMTFFSRHFQMIVHSGGIALVGTATLAAFIGAFIGSRLMKKVTLKVIQWIVGTMLLIIGISLAVGLI